MTVARHCNFMKKIVDYYAWNEWILWYVEYISHYSFLKKFPPLEILTQLVWGDAKESRVLKVSLVITRLRNTPLSLEKDLESFAVFLSCCPLGQRKGVNFDWAPLCAWPCAKAFAGILPSVLRTDPFNRWVNWGSARWSYAKATHS